MRNHRAQQIGNNWYCCQLIPDGNPANDSHWHPRKKCQSEEAAVRLANSSDGDDALYFEPFGASEQTPAYA